MSHKLQQPACMSGYVRIMANKQKIMIELSGGVDSAASLFLLKEKGFDVFGVMMLLHDNPNFSQEVESAKQICEKFKCPFELIDVRKSFKKNVIDYFINTYKQAKTPNPCIVCNMTMKFGLMFEHAKKLNCEKIATGHYARITCQNNIYNLMQAKDKSKDQSYVLFFLNQNQLSKLEFPLGEYTKEEIRKIAKNENFPCFDKQESQDICFIEDGDYPKFIIDNSNYKNKKGNVVDSEGNILGKHSGLINYTIGQRKGLGLAFSQPMYVTSLDAKNNSIQLGNKQETLSNNVAVNDIY